MAITNAQQYKQLLANGGSTNDISLEEAKDMAPKGEFLAYINKKEAKMLKDAGGSGVMTNAGIPSFRPQDYGQEAASKKAGFDQSDTSNPYSKASQDANKTLNDRVGGGNNTGGTKTKPKVTKTKDKKEKRKNFIKDYLKNRQELAFNISMLAPRQKARSSKYQKAYKAYLENMGVTPPDTLTGEEDDLANFFVNNAFDKPVAADANLETPQSYGEFLAENFGAPGVMMSGNVGGLETFVKTRDEITGKPLTYGYTKEKEGGGDNSILPISQPVASITEPTGYVNPLSLLTPRIAGTRFLGTEFEDDTEFAAKGGRIGLFKGAQADASAGKGAMSPGTDTGGGFRGGNGDGPKGPPSVINPPKTNPVLERIKKRNIPSDSPFKKFLAHDKFTDQLKARQAKNYHQLGALDFMARFPNINPDVAKMLASGYQNIFEVGRAVADGPGGKTIGNALDTAKEEARLNAVGIDAFSNPTSSLYQEYANMVPESGAVQMAGGGIASLEDMDREAFLLGGIAKGLKKAVRGVKKIAKSPLGKAALGLAAFKFGPAIFGKGSFNPFLRTVAGDTAFSPLGSILSKAGLVSKAGLPTFKGGITLTSILPLLVGKTDEEKDDILKDYYASQQLTPSTTKRQMGSEFDFYNYNLAEGGMPSKEPVAKKVMPLLDMDGMEKDYRADGGFVPLGRMEKADDVPARLSKNEFVFTADAVRNAGEGDVDKGAEVMYNMMKNLESGGEVSEESQGLDGAREMFQTSQRLGEVI